VKTSDFFYHLPTEYIAQHPLYPRDSSKLLVYDRKSELVNHLHFFDLPAVLNEDDLLVINQTRVIRARLYGKKIPTGGKVELLLLREVDSGLWESMVGGKGVKAGMELELEDGLTAYIEQDLGGPLRQVRFNDPIVKYLEEIGDVPLPPYIHEELEDPERYQTIYAKQSGSAAAPTAGLHFTPDLMMMIRDKGIQIAEVILHIGLDTFAPVNEDDPRDHHIHSEWCHLSQDTAEIINQTRNKGGRIIAVGTTSVRTLETAALNSTATGIISPYQGNTDLYILPGFQFQVVNCMITNFHLPESTLLMLVSAFCGKETILNLYNIAMRENYRFYSFGDAMLLL
jgi:S-adenosylmethionine:tRNA ribosyltransferase-isomerase